MLNLKCKQYSKISWAFSVPLEFITYKSNIVVCFSKIPSFFITLRHTWHFQLVKKWKGNKLEKTIEERKIMLKKESPFAWIHVSTWMDNNHRVTLLSLSWFTPSHLPKRKRVNLPDWSVWREELSMHSSASFPFGISPLLRTYILCQLWVIQAEW